MSESGHQGPRGALIVIEGLDKAGKSTQCARLVVNLTKQGREVLHLRFPNRTTQIGQTINNYLQGSSQLDDHSIHLLFSANRWEAASKIKSALASGTTVIIDRYYYSGVVYTVAKDIPSLDLDWCSRPEFGLPRSDICIFLSISPEEAAKRGGGYGTEKYEEEEMQRRVRRVFEGLVGGNHEDFVVVDAGGEVEEVERLVLERVEDVIARVRRGELGEEVREVTAGQFREVWAFEG